MPTYVHGKRAAVVHGGLNLQPWMREATASISLDPADTSHFGHDAKTYLIGQNDATFSGGGLYDGSIGGIEEHMEAQIAAETSGATVIPLTFAPEGVTTFGALTMLAIAKTTTYEVSPVISDVVTMSFEMQADGGMYGGVILRIATPLSSTTLGTAHDAGATGATTAGAKMHMHVLSNANTGNVTGLFQHSTNGTTWVDLTTFSAVTTGTDTAYRTAETSGAINRYTRFNLTLAGTGAVSVVATLARK